MFHGIVRSFPTLPLNAVRSNDNFDTLSVPRRGGRERERERDLLGTCPSMDGDYRKAIRNRGTEREVLGTRRIVVRLEPPQNREFIGLNVGRGMERL